MTLYDMVRLYGTIMLTTLFNRGRRQFQARPKLPRCTSGVSAGKADSTCIAENLVSYLHERISMQRLPGKDNCMAPRLQEAHPFQLAGVEHFAGQANRRGGVQTLEEYVNGTPIGDLSERFGSRWIKNHTENVRHVRRSPIDLLPRVI